MSDIIDPTAADTRSNPLPLVPPETLAPKRRHWQRYLLYALALVGVLLIGIVIVAIIRQSTKPKLQKIDEVAIIDEIMVRAYGRYSVEKKGWLYVDGRNHLFVVRVIQQAKIEAMGGSDELYFVASGIPLGSDAQPFYGVFQIRADVGAKEGDLIETSDGYRDAGAVAVAPENVRFEALSESTWAWVVKLQNVMASDRVPVTVRNVVLAPHGDEIAELATFKASVDADPGIDCGEANNRYAAQLKAREDSPNLAAGTPENEVRTALSKPDSDVFRCEHSRWTYRTSSVAGTQPGPLVVSSKGTQYGAPMAPKTWKLMFDNKSFSYNVPLELSSEDDPETDYD